MLEAIDGVDAVGIYSIANQAAESLWLIAAAIATAITAPVIRASEQEAVALVRRSLAKSRLYTAAAGAIVAVTAPFVIRFALGDCVQRRARSRSAPAAARGRRLRAGTDPRRLSLRSPRTAAACARCRASPRRRTVAAAFPLISAYGPSGAAACASVRVRRARRVGAVRGLAPFSPPLSPR